MSATLWLAFAILCEVFATSLLRMTQAFTRPLPSLMIVIGYGASFWCLSMAIRTLPVGVAYAIWSGVGIVLVSIIARLLYGERLDTVSIAAMTLIIAGAVILQLHHGQG